MTWIEPNVPDYGDAPPEGWREWTTEDELRSALKHAIDTIEFLHSCLTYTPEVAKQQGKHGGYVYAHPWMTEEALKQMKPLAVGAPECSAPPFSSKHEGNWPCPYHHRLMPIES